MAVQPNLRLALANPAGNVEANLDTISLTDLADALGLGVSGPILAAARRLVDFTVYINAGINDGDGLAIANLNAVGINEFLNASPVVPLVVETVGGSMTLRRLNGRAWWQLNSIAGAGNHTILRVRCFNQPSFRMTWRDTLRAVAGSLPADTPTGPAVVWQSWMSKANAGDATHSTETFGFADYNTLSPSGAISRAGLIGDGVTGFLYGSVNCPDGLAAGENAPTDRDAGSAGAFDPGGDPWHSAIKIVPPTASTPGRWAAYHNYALVKIFDTLTNFPRGGSAVSHDFTMLECMSRIGPVALGWAHHQTRFTMTEDLALGATLTF